MPFGLALVYNAINSTIDSFRGKHDTFGGMAAGAITGALYKSTGRDSRLHHIIKLKNSTLQLALGLH
jgi:hypothetical protein